MTDPYTVLGISRDASDEDLTKAYRKLAKKYHPDLNRDNKEYAQKKMAEINAAYEQIKDMRSGKTSSSSYGGYSSYESSSGTSWTTVVRQYISAGAYQQALMFLSTVSQRNAEWYFYSAVAYSGTGNRLSAIQYAQRACEMDPSNQSYRTLLEQLQGSSARYKQTESTFNMPNGSDKWCLRLCLINLLCNGFGFCCRPC